MSKRREIVTQAQIIHLTREIIRGFYGRSIVDYISYLHDDFIWIGAFDFQFATSKQEFLEVIQSELDATPFIMSGEHYEMIARDRDTFVLYCKFNLGAALPDQSRLQMHTRLTVVWRYVDGSPKLVHIHGSNAQDIPLNVAEQVKKTAHQDPADFLGYIKATTAQEAAAKVLFRTAAGLHQVFSEYDILYLKAEGQRTRVCTKEGSVVISGILRTHLPRLSGSFYRTHKTYLVNLAWITSLCRYRVTLFNGQELPVSKERYLALKEALRVREDALGNG